MKRCSTGEQAWQGGAVTPCYTASCPPAGLLELFDAPHSLPLIAPRPLLIANGELDPRCHMQVRRFATLPASHACSCCCC